MESINSSMETNTTDRTPRIVNPPLIRDIRTRIPCSSRINQVLYAIDQIGGIENATPEGITEAMNKTNDNVDNTRMSIDEVKYYLPFARRLLLLERHIAKLLLEFEAVTGATRNAMELCLLRRLECKRRVVRVLREYQQALSSYRLEKTLAEAVSAPMKNDARKDGPRLQGSSLKTRLKSSRWTPYGVPLSVDDDTEDICRRLAGVVSLKDAPDITRVSSRAGSDLRDCLRRPTAEARRGGPIRQRRPRLIDVNNVVDNLRDLTL